jgi:uncharacterized protein YvpB
LLFSACETAAPVKMHIEPSQTTTPLASPTLSITPAPTNTPDAPTPTPIPEDTSTPTIRPTPDLPEEHYIQGVRGHRQFFPLGCEAGVAVDWAAFFGIQIVEFNFQYELPKSDNPELGFVGDVRSPWGQVPPYGYGVHAAPVAALLQKYGLKARAVKGFTLDGVKQELASDQPVIAWVIGNMVGGVPADYTDSQGNHTIVAAYEHVVLLTGYNQKRIHYNNNGKIFEVPYDVFLNSWSVLGNMAIIMED